MALAGVTLLAWRQSRELVAGRTMALNGDERAAFEARLAELRRRNRQLQAALTAVRSGSGGMEAGSGREKGGGGPKIGRSAFAGQPGGG